MTGRNFNKIILALLLIGIGVVFLLSNFGVLDIDIGDLFTTYWPVILIWMGVSTMFAGFRYSRRGWGASTWNVIVGLILLLLGWNFLADNLGWTAVSFGLLWNIFWPLLLIYFGIKLLFRKKSFRIDVDFDGIAKKEYEYEDTVISEGLEIGKERKSKRVYKSSLIGDINMGKEMFELENLHLWNGIGDVDLDLTRAILPEGEAKILISGWIGDIDVIVPKDMAIWIETRIKIGEIRVLGVSEDGISKEQEYKSPGYDEAFQKVHMIIELKIGDIRVVER